MLTVTNIVCGWVILVIYLMHFYSFIFHLYMLSLLFFSLSFYFYTFIWIHFQLPKLVWDNRRCWDELKSNIWQQHYFWHLSFQIAVQQCICLIYYTFDCMICVLNMKNLTTFVDFFFLSIFWDKYFRHLVTDLDLLHYFISINVWFALIMKVRVTIHELLKSHEFTKPIAINEVVWYMVMVIVYIVLFFSSVNIIEVYVDCLNYHPNVKLCF